MDTAGDRYFYFLNFLCLESGAEKEGGLGRIKISFGPRKAHLYLVVGLRGSQNWA